MIYDYFAAGSYLYEPDHVQRKVIDYLVGGQSPLEQFAALSAIKDPTAKVEMLALAQLSVKSYAQSGDPRAKTHGIRDAIGGLKDNFQIRLNRDLGPLGLLPAIPDMNELPEWSFAIHLKFTLRQPYYSRDDSALYLLENPIRKEKVFRLPYIAPTQWKGTLHSVMVRQLAIWWERKLNIPLSELQTVSDKRQQARWWRENLKEPVSENYLKEFIHQRTKLFKLFGTERDFANEKRTGNLYLDGLLPISAGNWQASKYGRNKLQPDSVGEWQARKYRRFVSRYIASNGFLAGRLSFYPSFFTQIGLEVMNPHSRKTGSGELPILLETIPKGATADFLLLYVPRDCVGKPSDETAKQVAEDLQMIARGLREMFCLYGFGAKTSSGFGRAEETVEGKIVMRTKNDAARQALREQSETAEKQSGQMQLPKYLEAPDRLKPEYLNPDGTFKERPEAELQQLGKKAKQEYYKARRWWMAQQAEKDKKSDAESKQEESWPELVFKNFGDLEKIVDRIAKAL